jgi:condensin complex subunit 3
VSPTSSEEKLRESYGIVSEAVEEGLVTDTTGRNALYKIHVSLGKIVNSLEEQRPAQTRDGRSASEPAERSTPEDAEEAEEPEPEAEPEAEEAEEAEEEEEPEEPVAPVVKPSRTRGRPKIKREETSDDEGTVIPDHRDELVEDLLSDEDTKMEDVY